MSRPLAAAFLVLIFIAGIAAGVAVDRLLLLEGPPRGPHGPHGPGGPHGPPRPEEMLEILTRELALRPDQLGPVKAAIEEGHAAAESVMRRTRPEMDAARETARTKIRAVLDEAQQKKLDALTAEMERHGPPPGDGPPPGPPPGFP